MLYVFVAATFGSQAAAQLVSLPVLGSRASEQVMAGNGDQQCMTDIDHHDPCASIKIKNVLFTIAWDADAKTVSYLFTEDHHFVTDSELGIGGSCNVAPKVGEPVALFPYLDWLVTPKWADTRQDLSGDALWYAALQKDATHPRYDRIAGFVQSRYLTEAKEQH
ncbi:MAG TPA: hypothetical protein VNO32_52270 [Candidatus Acidoferrum sp.]|jgi:hypothetical protein|nr:hypothetical protein [Candidatus Acidoferrum sp.]